MKLIHRYIVSTLTQSTLFTLMALLGLYGFFDLLGEVPNLGTGNYTFGVMAGYVALLMPGHAYELMPLAVLIGGMVAMTQLASSSEYTVIRTSGVTLNQIAGTLVKFGIGFALLTIILGEFVAPWAMQEAQRSKLSATHSMVAQEFRSGIWVKDNQNFINVHEMLPDNTLLGLRIYTYDEDFKLVRTSLAERGTFMKNEHSWLLENVKQTELDQDHTVSSSYATLKWKSIVEPGILSVLLVVPEQMSAMNLLTYIEHLKKNKQQTQRYEIALWSKLFYPLACISMALVALAFTPQQRRHGQLGIKLFAGICLGVTFFFINRLFGHLGLLYDWNAILSATLPTLTFLLGGIGIIAKQERR
ncbi:LPS export ABC transporter permease LptG [Chromobacterium sp. IIBBL 290-4]|uniref:LPS export ABC transporter permease LptG n=1 Tax=Chromobacterium sp. IIBBL 290-4 TaxID=2953890 RepID=UPI0020B6C542|nr:LPS export ABC transporter permease LptG [Chromobacterium sp. IIBBL 290-4]UTH73420.1 LPS export ABC transporter permease LptG [Chromobacterium sp. IIBBL 290-4]